MTTLNCDAATYRQAAFLYNAFVDRVMPSRHVQVRSFDNLSYEEKEDWVALVRKHWVSDSQLAVIKVFEDEARSWKDCEWFIESGADWTPAEKASSIANAMRAAQQDGATHYVVYEGDMKLAEPKPITIDDPDYQQKAAL